MTKIAAQIVKYLLQPAILRVQVRSMSSTLAVPKSSAAVSVVIIDVKIIDLQIKT